MTLSTRHLGKTLDTLEQSLLALQQHDDDSVMHDLFRNAAIKGFELSLETIGKLLRKALKAFAANPAEVDRLVFNDVLRRAGTHGMLDLEGVERWLAYRKNRNATAHDYSEAFANETLALLPVYLRDARHLGDEIQKVFDASNDPA